MAKSNATNVTNVNDWKDDIRDIIENLEIQKSKDVSTIGDIISDTSSKISLKYSVSRQDSKEYIMIHIHHSKKDGYYFNFKRKKIKTNEALNILHLSLNDYSKVVDKRQSDIFDKIFDKMTELYPTLNIKQDIQLIKKSDVSNEPYGTQWVHDIQEDDELDEVLIERTKIYERLRSIILPVQRSDEWFSTRRERITASDCGTILELNGYEAPFGFILKKTLGSTFTSSEPCYHGKKFEEIATMIYSYRMNVTVEEFGLMAHNTIDILAASPDGIANQYKLNGINKSKYVGRMLEIKCPFSRNIIMEGDIYDGICPKYYYAQVQIQLECCDLEECDFWQCKMIQYDSRDHFIFDTDEKEPFRSKEYGLEKGCLIQLIPKSKRYIKYSFDKLSDVVKSRKWARECQKYYQMVYDDATFIHPPKIEMTPYDCDLWVAEQMIEIENNPIYKDCKFDKVFYWYLKESKNVTIVRDREWFRNSMPTFEKMWKYVVHFRQNLNKLELFKDYVDSFEFKYGRYTFKTKEDKERNDKIMNVAELLLNDSDGSSITHVKHLIEQNELETRLANEMDEVDFID